MASGATAPRTHVRERSFRATTHDRAAARFCARSQPDPRVRVQFGRRKSAKLSGSEGECFADPFDARSVGRAAGVIDGI